MNDYLGNLAARTFGQLSAVEPRLASRFEPAESPPGLQANNLFLPRAANSIDDELLNVDVESFAEASPRVQTARPRQSVARAEQTSEVESHSDAPAVSELNLTQAAPLSTAISIKATPIHPVAESHLQPSEQQDPRAASQPTSQTPVSAQVQPDRAADVEKLFADLAELRLERMLPSEVRAEVPRPAEDQWQMPPSREQTDGKPSNVFSFAEPRQPAEQRVAVAAVVPTLPPVPAIERQPVIKVTIGRVEVRAVVSAPTASATAAAEKAPTIQALPLNEYLRRRTNGEL